MKLIIVALFIILPSPFIYSSEETTPITNPTPGDSKERMLGWSRQLGVTCVHCHNLDNFKDATKPTFKMSMLHRQSVRILQEEVFNQRDKGHVLKVQVDCYMCHRGKALPDFREPPNQLTR
jgi:hypothetical protein